LLAWSKARLGPALLVSCTGQTSALSRSQSRSTGHLDFLNPAPPKLPLRPTSPRRPPTSPASTPPSSCSSARAAASLLPFPAQPPTHASPLRRPPLDHRHNMVRWPWPWRIRGAEPIPDLDRSTGFGAPRWPERIW
jgi:hypothetical protein